MDQIPTKPASDLAEHGGNLEAARRAFPGAPEPFIDLSTGINPFAYPIPPLPEDAWRRLPERGAITALQEAAAQAYGVSDAAMVVAAPGSQSLISLLPHVFRPASVAILGPTFGEYARAFARAGARVKVVGSLAETRGAEVIVICNPNNPDGRKLRPKRILSHLQKQADHPLLIVDEAFVDFEEPSLSLAPSLPEVGLVILRSFSKPYGLGGLRLGFALARSGLVEQIREALGPWPVSGAAIEIGKRAFAHTAWKAATKTRLTGDTKRLDGLLQGAGLKLIGGTHLFRLFASESAADVFERLGQAGILVRRFREERTWLRFGIPGDEDAWARLERASKTDPD
jgi:cobalamin biosynthetic protein CobC